MPILFRVSRFAGRRTSPPPGRKDDAADSHQVFECPLFQVSKVVLSALRENLGDAASLSLRNEFINIHEAVAGEPGETTTHRGFPAAHESDENEVGKHPLKFS